MSPQPRFPIPDPDGTHVSEQEARAIPDGVDLAAEAPAAPSPVPDMGPLERLIALNPVVAAAAALAIPIVASFIQALVDGEPLRAAASAAVAAAGALIAARVRDAVTPLADAKLGPGLPLVLDPLTPEPPPPPRLPAEPVADEDLGLPPVDPTD